MIGDYLYQLTPRDSQSPLIQSAPSLAILAGAQLQLTGVFLIPFDQCYMLKGWQVRAEAGATQTVTLITLSIQTPEGNLGFADLYTKTFIGAEAVQFNTQRSEVNDLVLIGGEHRIRAAVSYSNNVNSNLLSFSIWGHLLPRGNIRGSTILGTP